jgi:DNA-binding winged helix-turn-helix (wHTH) protein/tetratricopeptide (TPR) repeat protein
MSRHVLKFGEFLFDRNEQRLRRRGAVVRLTPQRFRVLSLLVEAQGALVRRETLREAVWGQETVVDFEHGLNACIRDIRRVLGDDADDPRFIETVPRVGYRFIAPVTVDEPTVIETHGKPSTAMPRWAVRAAAMTAICMMLALTSAVVLGRMHVAADVAQMREAQELYVRGRLALDDPTPGSARAALALFERALASDSRYAPALAGIASVYLQKPSSTSGVAPDVATARAEGAVRRALAVDPKLPEGHLAAAELAMTRRDWQGAGNEYRQAVALAPNQSVPHQRYAVWLSFQGRIDEALAVARVAETLDPLSPRARNTVAEVLRNARRFEEAIAQAQRALDLNPNYGPAHSILGHCYLALGRYDQAVDEHRRSGNTGGNLGFALARAGRRAEAERVLASLQERYARTRGGAGEIAQVYIGLGDLEVAFAWLSQAVADGAVWTLKIAEVWDPLRADPRFAALLKQSGIGE